MANQTTTGGMKMEPLITKRQLTILLSCSEDGWSRSRDDVLEYIDQLHTVIKSLLEIGAAVTRDDEILENRRRREIARRFVNDNPGNLG